MIFQNYFNRKIMLNIILFLFVLRTIECKKHHRKQKTPADYKRSTFIELQEDPLFDNSGPSASDATEIGTDKNIDSSGDVVEKTSGASLTNLNYNNEGTPTSSDSFSDASASYADAGSAGGDSSSMSLGGGSGGGSDDVSSGSSMSTLSNAYSLSSGGGIQGGSSESSSGRGRYSSGSETGSQEMHESGESSRIGTSESSGDSTSSSYEGSSHQPISTSSRESSSDDSSPSRASSQSKPEATSAGTSKPEATSVGTSKPEATSTGTSKPEASSEWTSKPEASSEWTSKPEASSEGTSKPEATSTGTSKPEASSEGTSKPEASSEGTSKPEATSTGTSKPEATSAGTSKPETTSARPSKPSGKKPGSGGPFEKQSSPTDTGFSAGSTTNGESTSGTSAKTLRGGSNMAHGSPKSTAGSASGTNDMSSQLEGESSTEPESDPTEKNENEMTPTTTTGVESNLALGKETLDTTNTSVCANCSCGDCNTIEISLPLACLHCPQCLKCNGGKTPCIDPGCNSGNVTIQGECSVEKVFHQCCNTFLANLNEIPPCNVFNTNNCKIGNQRLHDNKAMNYLIYVQTVEPYDEQFSRMGSEKANKLRQKIHNFFLRVYADNDFFLDLFGLTFSNKDNFVNAKMLVRFTKEVKGNIHVFFKAIMCDCGCYLFKQATLKIDIANATDLIEFCEDKCKFPSTQCINPIMSNCEPSCCIALPIPKLPIKPMPSFNMPQIPFMKPRFFNPMPSLPPPPPTSNFPLLCDPNCSVFCSQMCPPMCCNNQFNFKRSNLEQPAPQKHVGVNFFQRNYNL